MSDNQNNARFETACARYQSTINDAARCQAVADLLISKRPRNVLVDHPEQCTQLVSFGTARVKTDRHWIQRNAALQYLGWIPDIGAGLASRCDGGLTTVVVEAGNYEGRAASLREKAEREWDNDTSGCPSWQKDYYQQIRPIPPRVTIQDFTACGNCGQDDHTLVHCVWPSVDGYVHGCPWCNTRDHELPCPNSHPLEMGSKMVLLSARANRPLLAVYPQPWEDIIKLLNDHQDGINENITIPSSFPWSQGFPERVVGMVTSPPWENIIYSNPDYKDVLPSDPRSRTLGLISENLEFLKEGPLPLANAPRIESGMTAEKIQEAVDDVRFSFSKDRRDRLNALDQ